MRQKPGEIITTVLLRRIIAAQAVFLGSGILLVSLAADARSAGRWSLLSAAILAWEWWRIRRALPGGESGDAAAYWPVANWITFFRGLLLAGLGGVLAVPAAGAGWQIACGIAYSLAALADFADGYVARKRGETSSIGERLDGEFDALGLLLIPLLGIVFGRLPVLYVLVAVAYPAYRAGLTWRRRTAKPVFQLPDSSFRRIQAGFQMGFLAVILYPVYGPPGTLLTAYVFMIPFLAVFIRDWLIASGRLNPATARYRLWYNRIRNTLLNGLPLLLRLVIPVLLAGPAWEKVHQFEDQVSFFSSLGLPRPALMVILVAGVEFLAGLGLVLGIAPRSAALALMFIMGAAMQWAAPNFGNTTILISATLILLLGGGRWTLWNPEHGILFKHDESS